jgi:hypothetical protein
VTIAYEKKSEMNIIRERKKEFGVLCYMVPALNLKWHTVF